MNLFKGGLKELEEVGQVGVFALLLIPGAIWIAKAKTPAGVAVRSLLVGGFLAGAAVIEGVMDRTANTVIEGE